MPAIIQNFCSCDDVLYSTQMHIIVLPPLSLYIHVPWCVRKCPYCDFNSHQAQGPLPEKAYLAALLADLEQDLSGMRERAVISVFIGGGTPSLLSPETVYDLLAEVRTRVRLLPGAEITLEANPGTVDAGRFKEFRQAGVNRLSIGVQSFSDTALRSLGRIHGRADAQRAMEAVLSAGFENFNADLMFGLHGQNAVAALDDLRNVIAFNPPHLSWYQLTLEPNTLFYRSPPVLPGEDALQEIQTAGQALLKQHGYSQYEVSAYAKPGRRCQHNCNYWQFGDYLGIGAGAHAKLSDAGGVTRFSKLRHPQAYLQALKTQRHALDTRTRLTSEEVALEFMLNALRLCEGFPAGLFAAHTGLDLDIVEKPLQTARQRGWIEQDKQNIRATDIGMQFLNDLLELFVQ
ncbi:MAG: radical SAM family heme chaperone HemW [Gammaproteobacteria bacterium]|nr:radical SAM family heme chaperone HemW [Gammaproteobacteria bacterium]